jgi:hypothetical protein
MPLCQFPVSAIFVFQKSYTGNILGIGRNKSKKFLFFPKRHGVQRRDGVVPGGGRTTPWCGPPLGRTGVWCGPLAHTLMPLFRLYIPLDGKT